MQHEQARGLLRQCLRGIVLPLAESRADSRCAISDSPGLRREVFEYIETYYNLVRRHSALGHISPATFETGSRLTRCPNVAGRITLKYLHELEPKGAIAECHDPDEGVLLATPP